ncbi:MAG: hypothetical protein JWO98_2264 [Frankiales bacterium]|nr:hypothetical protein [Frankiales bacterium]
MRLTLQVRYDDSSGTMRALSRDVTRPYPGVPRAGELVFLGEIHADRYVPERRVQEVRYENDGRVTLVFEFDGLSNDPGPQLEALRAEGFR